MPDRGHHVDDDDDDDMGLIKPLGLPGQSVSLLNGKQRDLARPPLHQAWISRNQSPAHWAPG